MKEVTARYSEEADTFLVLCPYCKHVTRHRVGQISVKQWLGVYTCNGGVKPGTKDEWEDCFQTFKIVNIV